MQLNPTLVSQYAATLRLAAPPDKPKNQILHTRTQQLNDSNELTGKLTPRNTLENTHKSLKKDLKSQFYGQKITPTHSQRPTTRDPLKTKQDVRTFLPTSTSDDPRTPRDRMGVSPSKCFEP
jgi:hypothetical protein